MFIETQEWHNINLTFIKSTNVQVYPCGRRRSELVDADNKPDTTSDQYYIPFDPEARLNTEANNRKHSGLNGFTQTYLKSWDEGNKLLSLSLAGYLFNISLDTLNTPELFSQAATSALSNASTATKIYANIRIHETPLFSAAFQSYRTGVLRNQSGTDQDSTNALTTLDLIKTDTNLQDEKPLDVEDPENYYFSGLSFSTSPITFATEYAPGSEYYAREVETTNAYTVVNIYKKGEDPKEDKLVQQVISLCILEKKTNDWQIYQPACLPQIEHGDTAGSIKVNTLNAENLDAINLDAKKIKQDGKSMPIINLIKKQDTWQLQLSSINND